MALCLGPCQPQGPLATQRHLVAGKSIQEPPPLSPPTQIEAGCQCSQGTESSVCSLLGYEGGAAGVGGMMSPAHPPSISSPLPLPACLATHLFSTPSICSSLILPVLLAVCQPVHPSRLLPTHHSSTLPAPETALGGEGVSRWCKSPGGQGQELWL